MYDTQNIFARIIRGEIPCNKVYEDDYALAFHDIHPKAPVHVLVVPKGEYKNILEFHIKATPSEQSGFWHAVKSVTEKLGLSSSSYRCVANTGAPIQEVFHFHLHIMGENPKEK